MKPAKQKNAFSSPWSWSVQFKLMVWRITWLITCSWTPKFFNPWRLCVLKIFGAGILGNPFVHGTVRIQIPWHIKLHDRACLGDRVCAYSLGIIEVQESATVAQEVYLCTGTHDFESSTMQLITDSITIGKNAFVGVRAIILPGVKIDENAVIGANAVVTKNVSNNEIFAGNPARKIGIRKKLS